MTPSWASTVRKALVATAVAFTVAGGVVLAAVADDHVTTTEWVTIALTFAGALVGPTAVYAVPNASRSSNPPGGPAHVLAPQDDQDSARRPDWWTEPQ